MVVQLRLPWETTYLFVARACRALAAPFVSLAVIVVGWAIPGWLDVGEVAHFGTERAHAQTGVPVTLSGTIVDAQGAPLAGQRVRLFPGGGAPSFDATTDANGFYTLTVSAGSYGIDVDVFPGTNPPSVAAPQSYSFSRTSPLSLTADTTLNVTIPARAVTVHVVDGGGAPLAGVKLATAGVLTSAIQLGGQAAQGISSYSAQATSPATTDGNGNATLWLFPTVPGASSNFLYTIGGTPPAGSPFQPGQVGGVAVNGPTNVTLTLLQPVRLSGVVRDANGTPLAGQRVRLFPGGGSTAIDASTNGAGEYSLTVSPGSYGIDVDVFPGANPPTVAAPQSYSFSRTAPLSLTADTTLNVTIPAQPVTVHVVDGSGTPLAGVKLGTVGVPTSAIQLGGQPAQGISSYSGQATSPATTDGSGNATLWLFPTAPGASPNFLYTIGGAPPSGSPFQPGQVGGVAVNGPTSVTLTLLQPVRLSGVVRDSNGTPLAGQRVRLFAGGGSAAIDASTNGDGEYGLTVSPGSYGIDVDVFPGTNPPTVAAPQSYSFSRTAPLSLTADTTLNVTIPARAVTVQVLDPSGIPMPGVKLGTMGILTSAIQLGGQPAQGISSYSTQVASPATTDANGRATLWLFPNAPGASSNLLYALTVTPAGGSGFLTFVVQGVSVTGDMTETVQLGQTITLAASNAGATSVQVKSSGGITAGSLVTVNPGQPNEETVQVTGVGSTIQVTPLSFGHAPNEPVVSLAAACTPRQRIGVQVTRVGTGLLRATLTAPRGGALASNTLTSVRMDRLDNATVDMENGATNLGVGATIQLANRPVSVTLLVRRGGGGPFMARLTVNDTCGGFSTLVGGGTGVP